MNYEKVSNPIYKFEFDTQEATHLSDIMGVVISLGMSPGEYRRFTDAEVELAQEILNHFDESEV